MFVYFGEYIYSAELIKQPSGCSFIVTVHILFSFARKPTCIFPLLCNFSLEYKASDFNEQIIWHCKAKQNKNIFCLCQLTLRPLLPFCAFSFSSSSCLLCCRIALVSCLCSDCSSLQECQCSGFRYCMPSQKRKCQNWKYTFRRTETQCFCDCEVTERKPLWANKSITYLVSKTRFSERWAESGWAAVFAEDETALKPRIIRTPSRLRELSKIMPASLASAFAELNIRFKANRHKSTRPPVYLRTQSQSLRRQEGNQRTARGRGVQA